MYSVIKARDFSLIMDKKIYGEEVSSNIYILYGGSVKPENSKELFSTSDIDGALIGGASLDVDKFSKIVNFNDYRKKQCILKR